MQRAELIPGLAERQRRLALAHTAPDGPGQLTTVAQRTGDGYVLDGYKSVVGGAPAAHGLLVSGVEQQLEAFAAAY